MTKKKNTSLTLASKVLLPSALVAFSLALPQEVQASKVESVTEEPLTAPKLANEAKENAVETTSEGSENKAFTVEQYKEMTPSDEVVSVSGYITGSLSSTGTQYRDADTNFALGQTPDALAKDTVPVQLPKSLRKDYSVLAHPELIGSYTTVTGLSQKYMGRIGIKGTTAVTLENATDPENTEKEPELSSTAISTVRESPTNQSYTVSGKVISPVNGWGGNGFYLQDDSGEGIFVYPQDTNLAVREGDSLQVTGTLKDYYGELELVDITQHLKIEKTFRPSVTETTIPNLSTAPKATLVKLSNVKVGEINIDDYDTADFTVTDKDGNKVAVRLDNRTGFTGSALLTKINTGDTIDLTGILSLYRNQPQLKPFAPEQIKVIERTKENLEEATKVLKVSDIQGASHRSPYANHVVNVDDVVVTYVVSSSNFYVQDLHPDNDDRTSDGIHIFSSLKIPVRVGDKLSLKGTVKEYYGQGYDERRKTDLTITQIVATDIKIEGTADVPAPIVLGKDRIVPKNNVEDDGFEVFDPDQDALDFWESLEGMIVEIQNPRVLGPLNYDEIYVVPSKEDLALNKVGGVLLRPDGVNTEIVPILLNSSKDLLIKSGDYFTGSIVGPVTYSYTNYKVYTQSKDLPELHDGGVKPEETTIVPDEKKLTIASYNIENFSADPKSTKDSKVERIAKSFVEDLHTPDIIGLLEVQDNDGANDSGNTDASKSAQRLINAIKAIGGPTYRYVDIAPLNNQDGGQPGGNIRVAYLYNPERVSLSDKPKGSATDAVQWVNGELSMSVGRIDPTDPIWEDTRKSLAAEFVFQGHKVVVIANHLNSKRGDNGVYGSVQPITLTSEIQRHKLAQKLADFVTEGRKQNPDINIVMLGDFNDFEFSKTISIIEKGGVSNLVNRHDQDDRFSYFYNGNNQSLDNMLLSQNLMDHYTFDMVHVNSPFMETQGRASDHDPLIVQLDFNETKKGNETNDKPNNQEVLNPQLTVENDDNKPIGNTEVTLSNGETIRIEHSAVKEDNEEEKTQPLPSNHEDKDEEIKNQDSHHLIFPTFEEKESSPILLDREELNEKNEEPIKAEKPVVNVEVEHHKDEVKSPTKPSNLSVEHKILPTSTTKALPQTGFETSASLLGLGLLLASSGSVFLKAKKS